MASNIETASNFLSGLGIGGSSTDTSKPGTDWGGLLTTGLTIFGQDKPTAPTSPITAPPPSINNSYNFSVPTDSPAVPKDTTTFTYATATDTATKKDNTLLYVGIGTGVVVLIIVLYFVFKKK